MDLALYLILQHRSSHSKMRNIFYAHQSPPSTQPWSREATISNPENNLLLDMLQSQKLINSSPNILPLTPSPSPKVPPLVHSFPATSTSLASLKQTCNLSRRELTLRGNSSLLLLWGTLVLEPFNPSMAGGAEELPNTDKNEQVQNCTAAKEDPTERVFLDVSIDGKPAGRIVIGLYGDSAPAGAARFRSLASGTAGISYRRKEFIKIMPNYVQHGGVRSYGVDAELAQRTGSNLEIDNLMEEWKRINDKCPAGTKNLAGTVGIIVRDPSKPPPKIKLVARKGKLEIDQEEVGKDPNGTEFVIATRDSPELDASALVVGRVLEGMEVAEKIEQVKTVQENTSSPYFRVAKLIGDKRAVVAERGFNRPYSKVLVTNCGLME